MDPSWTLTELLNPEILRTQASRRGPGTLPNPEHSVADPLDPLRVRTPSVSWPQPPLGSRDPRFGRDQHSAQKPRTGTQTDLLVQTWAALASASLSKPN